MVYLIIIYDQLYPVLSHYLGEGSVWVRARAAAGLAIESCTGWQWRAVLAVS